VILLNDMVLSLFRIDVEIVELGLRRLPYARSQLIRSSNL